MIDLARQGWRWIIVQGALTMLFGLTVSIWPRNTVLVLLMLLVLGAIAGGLASLVQMFTRKDNILAVVGLGLLGFACLALGVVSIFWPPVAAVALLIAIVLQALVAAIFLIVFGLQIRQLGGGGGLWTIILGAVACATVPALLIWRWTSAAEPGDMVGTYAVVVGIILIVGGFVIPRELPDAPQPAVATQ